MKLLTLDSQHLDVDWISFNIQGLTDPNCLEFNQTVENWPILDGIRSGSNFNSDIFLEFLQTSFYSLFKVCSLNILYQTMNEK